MFFHTSPITHHHRTYIIYANSAPVSTAPSPNRLKHLSAVSRTRNSYYIFTFFGILVRYRRSPPNHRAPSSSSPSEPSMPQTRYAIFDVRPQSADTHVRGLERAVGGWRLSETCFTFVIVCAWMYANKQKSIDVRRILMRADVELSRTIFWTENPL